MSRTWLRLGQSPAVKVILGSRSGAKPALLRGYFHATIKMHKIRPPVLATPTAAQEPFQGRLLRFTRKDRLPGASGAVFSIGVDDRDDEQGYIDGHHECFEYAHRTTSLPPVESGIREGRP
ncbi:hypothetical protein Btus_3193 [Kyrpidia tusciae DSM 2912]|uniref:Uncharacterized protein n=1 Tax=Kyrpidia tusciae (strain DSM 2912 / NBRC 15312 / T2) TaxID=562970 RepID=D5WX23_KYRT2|nr:hypothetical protein Btus_3193 [Kyrpidia tusciae DSM 2912]